MYLGLENYIKSLSLPNTELWVCTNGELLNNERLIKLHEAGLRNIWYSFFYTNELDYRKYVRSDSFSTIKNNLYNLISKSDLFDRIKIVTFSRCAEQIEKIISGKRKVYLQKERKNNYGLGMEYLVEGLFVYQLMGMFVSIGKIIILKAR